jgi:hypothetical protein
LPWSRDSSPEIRHSERETHCGLPGLKRALSNQFNRAAVQDSNKIEFDLRFVFNLVKVYINKMKVQPLAAVQRAPRWIDALEDEDISFIKRFVLASGSLKELASEYGISYPTVRLRLDRLIEKVKLLDRHDVMSPFERVLRLQHAEGRIDRQTLKLLLDAHQAEIRQERNERERSPR